jgi:hypothetical protein
MSDPGLVILPTHRLLLGLPDLTAGQVRSLLKEHFQVEDLGSGAKAARDAWELIQADGGQDLLAFGTAADGRWQLARFGSPGLMESLAPAHSPAWRSLGVSILHVVVPNRLLDQAGFSPQCRYVHKMDDVMEAMSSRQCQVAALVPPATMTQVEQIAGNLEKMPPKSTFFYPKVLSGLVFNSLKGR